LKIPVIDIFAGPGGLGEGFSLFKSRHQSKFRICLSIEKDPFAYRTLRMRSFFRKIPFSKIRDAYLKFAKSNRTEKDEQLFFRDFPNIKNEVDQEVLCKELGNPEFPHKEVDDIITDCLKGSKKWVLIGGPPCQAYSLAGRSRMSRTRRDKFEQDKRHYLYQHYLRIIAEHHPPVFIMENVKGMLSSTIHGKLIVDKIIQDLKRPDGDRGFSYNLFPFVRGARKSEIFNGEAKFNASDFIIRSEDYGVPQARHRVIILGVRSDIKVEPEALSRQEAPVTLQEVISDLPRIRSGVSRKREPGKGWGNHIREIQTLLHNGTVSGELRKQMTAFLNDLGEHLPTNGTCLPYISGRPKSIVLNWYRKDDLGIVCNHEARTHMPSDLRRYFFSSCFAHMHSLNGDTRSPLLRDFPSDLLPDHNNINPDKTHEAIFNDRFRVQLWNKPATTITSHISKDGHYFIHPDPRQCRSLTVREAARVQTFPDNYIFLGPRTSQYQQVGNAVPPLLARQLAKVVYKLILRWQQN